MNFKPNLIKILLSVPLGFIGGVVFVEVLDLILEPKTPTSTGTLFFWIFALIFLFYLFISLFQKNRDQRIGEFNNYIKEGLLR